VNNSLLLTGGLLSSLFLKSLPKGFISPMPNFKMDAKCIAPGV
jgi:hypothetical protein